MYNFTLLISCYTNMAFYTMMETDVSDSNVYPRLKIVLLVTVFQCRFSSHGLSSCFACNP